MTPDRQPCPACGSNAADCDFDLGTPTCCARCRHDVRPDTSDLAALLHENACGAFLARYEDCPDDHEMTAARLAARGVIVAPDLLAAARAVLEATGDGIEWAEDGGPTIRTVTYATPAIKALRAAIEEADR